MWARTVEVMLGCWLAASPFILRHAAERTALWWNDLLCACAVIALALLSWSRWQRAHLAIAAVALWLVGFGFVGSEHPVPPALQNDIVVGLLLMMMAIVPNEASLPPPDWRPFFEKAPQSAGAALAAFASDSRREVVVVTGASAGVGRATAVAFAKRGARVALLARGLEGLEGARIEVQAAGGEALVIPTDVADPEQVEAAAEQVEKELGPIDVWVNNAMTTVFSPFVQIPPEEYKRATEVTYLGTVYGTLAALKRMIPRNRGKIVQVGSALAYRAIPLQAPYCGAKFAVRGFTDAIRSELIHDGSDVHLTMVQLPALNTPQHHWCKSRLPNHPQPVPPIFAPEVAAEAIVWAAHNFRRELWVGGPTVKAILGNKVLPGYLDRYLARFAYEGQQTDQPVPRDRPFNLFAPVPGDAGAHGIFRDRELPRSYQLWAATHRWALVLLAAALAGLAALLLWLGRTMEGRS
jgi:NAD(P)-dependent dehydrogenase (short-subunit alcohol dehydrogenase family)